jgi:putative flippase GtrA
MSLPRQVSMFFGVGVLSVVADYLTFYVLLNLVDLDEVPAALGGYAVGGVVNYLLNRAHTFDTERSHFEAGWRFMAVMAIGFTLTGLFMYLFVEKLDLHPWLSRVMTTGVVFVWNFVAHRAWSFAARS